MDVLKRFETYIEDNKLFNKTDKVLLAVSGGRDSMLLLWLCQQLGLQFEVAHCNFHLRGEESDADEALVQDYCSRWNISFHKKDFDTKTYSQMNKISIQMAARELRYAWFESLRQQINASYTLIAQHKNDHVETVLLNLSRGTGLKGLCGILHKKSESTIIRPLLFLSHREITEFVQQQAIPYRDDSSNFSNKYARNKIRLDIMPQFEELNTDFLEVMNDNIQRFQEANEVLQDFVEDWRKQIFKEEPNGNLAISLEDLKDKSLAKHYFIFESYGFSKAVLSDLISCYDSESGRVFESENYELLLDRSRLILSKKGDLLDKFTINETDAEVIWNHQVLFIEQSNDVTIEKNNSIAKIDLSLLTFPLVLRTWQEGDFFYPLGMKGKKKVSDYFIQQKLNLFEKKSVPILVNGTGEIIWIVNYRMDDRFKITENTQKVLKLVCSK